MIYVSHLLTTYLRQAEPHVTVRLVVVEVKLELRRLIRFEVERLVPCRFAAGFDLAVVASVRVHLQRTGVLLALVEGDSDFLEVLGFLKRVLDPAPLVVVKDVPLARPARVRGAAPVPGVFGDAAVRGTARVVCPLVVPRRTHFHGCPLACVDKVWYAGGI